MSEQVGRTLHSSVDRLTGCASSPVIESGAEWIIDATGCKAEQLASLEVLRSVCDQILFDLELKVLGEPQWHQFPSPGGVTGLYLLTESHLACHTYPEFELATFNLYCCRPQVQWDWSGHLRRELGSTEVHVRCIPRGCGVSSEMQQEGEVA